MHTILYLNMPLHMHAHMHTCIPMQVFANMAARMQIYYIHRNKHTCTAAYVGVYKDTYIHTYIRTYICLHAHIHACIRRDRYIHTYVHTYACMQTYMHAYTETDTYMHACMHACLSTQTRTLNSFASAPCFKNKSTESTAHYIRAYMQAYARHIQSYMHSFKHACTHTYIDVPCGLVPQEKAPQVSVAYGQNAAFLQHTRFDTL